MHYQYWLKQYTPQVQTFMQQYTNTTLGKPIIFQASKKVLLSHQNHYHKSCYLVKIFAEKLVIIASYPSNYLFRIHTTERKCQSIFYQVHLLMQLLTANIYRKTCFSSNFQSMLLQHQLKTWLQHSIAGKQNWTSDVVQFDTNLLFADTISCACNVTLLLQ